MTASAFRSSLGSSDSLGPSFWDLLEVYVGAAASRRSKFGSALAGGHRSWCWLPHTADARSLVAGVRDLICVVRSHLVLGPGRWGLDSGPHFFRGFGLDSKV